MGLGAADNVLVATANLDLAERLFNEGVHVVYICVHPETLKIVGFTILSFASDLLANNKLIRKAFPDALALLKKNDGVIEWNGPDAQKIKPVFDLVMTR